MNIIVTHIHIDVTRIVIIIDIIDGIVIDQLCCCKIRIRIQALVTPAHVSNQTLFDAIQPHFLSVLLITNIKYLLYLETLCKQTDAFQHVVVIGNNLLIRDIDFVYFVLEVEDVILHFAVVGHVFSVEVE